MTQKNIYSKIRNLILLSMLFLVLLNFKSITVSASVTDTTGPYYANANLNNTGWTLPTRLYTEGGIASVAETDGDSIVLYNFDIIYLGGVTIDGILVNLIAGTYDTGDLGTVTISILFNGRNSTASESKITPNIPNLYTSYNLGGAADKWGEATWSTDSFTNSNFGIKMVANGPLDINKYIGVQHVRVTVYYTGTIPEIQNEMLLMIPIILFSSIFLKIRKKT